jgi:hypothetical protein
MGTTLPGAKSALSNICIQLSFQHNYYMFWIGTALQQPAVVDARAELGTPA